MRAPTCPGHRSGRELGACGGCASQPRSAACVLVVGGTAVAIATVGDNRHHASTAGERSAQRVDHRRPDVDGGVDDPVDNLASDRGRSRVRRDSGLNRLPAPRCRRSPRCLRKRRISRGTIALANTTLTAEQATPLTLTLRNVSDHPVWLVSGLEVFGADGPRGGTTPADNAGFDGALFPAHTTFAAGQERTLTTSITPRPEMMVRRSLSLALHLGGLALDLAAHAEPVLSGSPDRPDLGRTARTDTR